MKITCPKCKTKIPVNPAVMLGSIMTEKKRLANKLNAQKPRPRKPTPPRKKKEAK